MDMKSNSKTRWGDNSKSKRDRVVILVCNLSSSPILHFYQVSSKYSKRYSCYRADTKSNLNTRRGDNSKRKVAKVAILVRDTWFHPVLHFSSIIKKFQRVLDLQSEH